MLSLLDQVKGRFLSYCLLMLSEREAGSINKENEHAVCIVGMRFNSHLYQTFTYLPRSSIYAYIQWVLSTCKFSSK